MKRLIPRNVTEFELTENCISIKKMDTSKIIVLSGSTTSAIGLLTKIPSGRWVLIDMLMARNLWDITSDSPIEIFDYFNSPSWKILQFEDRYEFLEWLNENIPKPEHHYL